MAGSLNKVTIIGNLGKDPDSRSFQNGGKVVNFSVATTESWNDRTSGEKREKTEWHRVAVFNEHLAKVAEQYLRKGSKVYLEGKIQTRKYQDQSGRDVYTTEIILQGFDAKMILLDGKQQRGSDDGYADGPYGGDQGNYRNPTGGAKTESSSRKDVFSADLDDDVPF